MTKALPPAVTLQRTRDALGLSSWAALAALLPIDLRTLHRWREGKMPPSYVPLLERACRDLIREHQAVVKVR